MVTALHIYNMTVITVKLNEESWAYIITDTEDSHFIEQELAKTIDTAKALYPESKVSVYGVGIQQNKINKIMQKIIQKKEETYV